MNQKLGSWYFYLNNQFERLVLEKKNEFGLGEMRKTYEFRECGLRV